MPAQRDLTDHYRHADNRDAQQVNQNEGTAGVLTGDVGKLPDTPKANGGTGGRQNKTQPAAPVFVQIAAFVLADYNI